MRSPIYWSMFLATWVATLAVIEIKPIKPEPPVGEHEAFWRDLLKLNCVSQHRIRGRVHAGFR